MNEIVWTIDDYLDMTALAILLLGTNFQAESTIAAAKAGPVDLILRVASLISASPFVPW
jgi:hypothetical protein